MTLNRCNWVQNDPLLIAYHDEEWGKQETEDQALFELLILELFQTGLSWRTVLQKREGFRAAFDRFDIERVAAYGETKVAELVENPEIIRHRGKIQATIYNAGVILGLIKEYGSVYHFFKQLPEEPKEQNKVMKKTFKHVGPSVLESFLISAGFVSTPHDQACFLYFHQKV